MVFSSPGRSEVRNTLSSAASGLVMVTAFVGLAVASISPGARNGMGSASSIAMPTNT